MKGHILVTEKTLKYYIVICPKYRYSECTILLSNFFFQTLFTIEHDVQFRKVKLRYVLSTYSL